MRKESRTEALVLAVKLRWLVEVTGESRGRIGASRVAVRLPGVEIAERGGKIRDLLTKSVEVFGDRMGCCGLWGIHTVDGKELSSG